MEDEKISQMILYLILIGVFVWWGFTMMEIMERKICADVVIARVDYCFSVGFEGEICSRLPECAEEFLDERQVEK